jgi:hypothetical protein
MLRLDMGIMTYRTCGMLGMAMALMSCAAPKATVVAETPAVKNEKPATPALEPANPPLPVDDGLRMPDMLAMPDAGDFRSTNSSATMTGNSSGAVISRPPTEAPPKPKAE